MSGQSQGHQLAILDSLNNLGFSLVLAATDPENLVLVNSSTEQVLVICAKDWDILRAETLEDAGKAILGGT